MSDQIPHPELTDFEMSYIVDAVGQMDIEYTPAPDDLLQRLEDWQERLRAACAHSDLREFGGHSGPVYECRRCGQRHWRRDQF